MIIFKLTTLITFHVHFRKYKETDCLPFTASRCKFHSNTNTKNEFNQQVWYSELPFSPVVSWHTKDFFYEMRKISWFMKQQFFLFYMREKQICHSSLKQPIADFISPQWSFIHLYSRARTQSYGKSPWVNVSS